MATRCKRFLSRPCLLLIEKQQQQPLLWSIERSQCLSSISLNGVPNFPHRYYHSDTAKVFRNVSPRGIQQQGKQKIMKERSQADKLLLPSDIPSPIETGKWFIDGTGHAEQLFGINEQVRYEIESIMNCIKEEELVNGQFMRVALLLLKLSPEQDPNQFAERLFAYWNLSNHAIVFLFDQGENRLGIYVRDAQPTPTAFNKDWLQTLSNNLQPLIASRKYKDAILLALNSVLDRLKKQYSAIDPEYLELHNMYKANIGKRRETIIGQKLRFGLFILALLTIAAYLWYSFYMTTDVCPDCDRFTLKLQKELWQDNYKDYEQFEEAKKHMSSNNLKELELGSCHFTYHKCSKCGFETVKRHVDTTVPIDHCFKCDTQAITTVSQSVASDPARKQIIRQCQFCGDSEIHYP
jgi:hypothetical protein